MAIQKKMGAMQRGGAAAAPSTTVSVASSNVTAPGWRLAKEWIPLLPTTKLMLYGESGVGKSTFAATYFEAGQAIGKPCLVISLDPPSKMSPYRDVGYDCYPVEVDDPFYTEHKVVLEHVVDKDGKVIAQIESYIDDDPDNPVAADALEGRFAAFGPQASEWFAVIRDSMTFFQYASLRRAKVRLPIDAANEAKGQTTNLTWYNMVKMDMERFIKSQGLWWHTNLVDIFHTSEDKSEFADTLVRGILAVGKLKDELPPGYDEIYKVKIDMKTKDADGFHKRYLQTRHDNVWTATSVTAKAPNPCEPHYLALWENWQQRKQEKGVHP